MSVGERESKKLPEEFIARGFTENEISGVLHLIICVRKSFLGLLFRYNILFDMKMCAGRH